ncbi:hypothetical protein, partial [Burkholderia contaminans]|uniref:hypothetical protein n=1 Tax=Burkholderia contaminans TaxID=488447 RepID=UPI001C2EFBD4
ARAPADAAPVAGFAAAGPAPGAGFGASRTRSAFSSVEGGAIGCPPFTAAEGGASTVSCACARAVANSDRHVTAPQANRLLALDTISPTPESFVRNKAPPDFRVIRSWSNAAHGGGSQQEACPPLF